MSATILGCGHAHHLMDINCLAQSPQVHLHFLTEADELEMLGYMKVELCCHGCGEAVLIYYDSGGDTRRHHELRDKFTFDHSLCADRGYAHKCPDYRSKVSLVDLRTKRRSKRRTSARDKVVTQ